MVDISAKAPKSATQKRGLSALYMSDTVADWRYNKLAHCTLCLISPDKMAFVDHTAPGWRPRFQKCRPGHLSLWTCLGVFSARVWQQNPNCSSKCSYRSTQQYGCAICRAIWKDAASFGYTWETKFDFAAQLISSCTGCAVQQEHDRRSVTSGRSRVRTIVA